MMENTGSYDNGCDTVNGYDENDSNSDINNDDNSQSNKCNGSKNDNTIITVVKKNNNNYEYDCKYDTNNTKVTLILMIARMITKSV